MRQESCAGSRSRAHARGNGNPQRRHATSEITAERGRHHDSVRCEYGPDRDTVRNVQIGHRRDVTDGWTTGDHCPFPVAVNRSRGGEEKSQKMAGLVLLAGGEDLIRSMWSHSLNVGGSMSRILYVGLSPFLISAAQPAFAWGTTKKTILCDNSVPGHEELVGQINANVVVKEGKSCDIDSAHIKGNITAKPGAHSLDIEGSFIEGSITTGEIDFFFFDQSTVTGSLKLRPPPPMTPYCLGNMIAKNVTIDLTDPPGRVHYNDNDSFKNVTLKNNEGFEEVRRNDMHSLFCINNHPPVISVDNDIAKNGKDTCTPW
jgi:hypothetical protein